MAAKPSKSPRKKSPSRAGATMTPAEKAAYRDIKQGIQHVERSIGEVRKGLRKAEKAIEADARARIRELRKEANAQIATLERKRGEASRLVKRLSVAAEESWHEVVQSADQVLAEARSTASAIADRIRGVLQR